MFFKNHIKYLIIACPAQWQTVRWEHMLPQHNDNEINSHCHNTHHGLETQCFLLRLDREAMLYNIALAFRKVIASVPQNSVLKNWRPDRFQHPWTLLQRPIFVDEVSAPAEFINSPTTRLALNGMAVDDTFIS